MNRILNLRLGRKSRSFRELVETNVAVMTLLRTALAAMPREEHLQRALMMNDETAITTMIESGKHALRAIDEARNATGRSIQTLLLYRAVVELEDQQQPDSAVS